MLERDAHTAASPFRPTIVSQMTQTIDKRELPRRGTSKSTHSGISAGETIDDGQTSRDSASSKPLSPPLPSFTTTFYLAYPPPHGSSPFRRMKPRLLLQLLQQAARKKRLQPVFDILLTAPVGFRYRQKDFHCRPGDIALLRGDFYSDCILPDGTRAEYSEGDEKKDEVESDWKTKVIAVIRDQRKTHARQYREGEITDQACSSARFFLSCGAIWEAVTARHGDHYQLVAADVEENKVNGDYKMISWTRSCSPENGGNKTQGDIEFRLSIVNGDFKCLPLVATTTRQSIQVSYQPQKAPLSSRSSSLLQSTSRKRAQSRSTRDSPFGSLDAAFSEPSYLLCLVLTSAVWVASSEGWLNL